MNKEPDNFPLFPHLRERSNKGIDRHTQRSKWVTELLDWPNLPNDLLAAAKEAEFCLRDQVIVLFVCDSGARPSEVIELSIGEWRTRGCQQEVLIAPKGGRDQGARLLRFHPVTAELLYSYVNGERKQYDLQHRELKLLADRDPLFLSRHQRAYTYNAFLPHWRQLCQVVGFSLPLHGLRIWYVLQQLWIIHEHPWNHIELDLLKNKLAQCMGWSSSRPLDEYEHYVRMKQDEEVMFRVLDTWK